MKRPGPLVAGLAIAATAALLTTSPAYAAPAADGYDDVQGRVGYTVYEPRFTAGLTLDRSGVDYECPGSAEGNVRASYGDFDVTSLMVSEGSPICIEPLGDGKIVGRVTIQGKKAVITVYCDFGQPAEWKRCRPSDMAKRGGDIRLTLPGTAGRDETEVLLTNTGSRPLTFAQLLRVARSLTPVAR